MPLPRSTMVNHPSPAGLGVTAAEKGCRVVFAASGREACSALIQILCVALPFECGMQNEGKRNPWALKSAQSQRLSVLQAPDAINVVASTPPLRSCAPWARHAPTATFSVAAFHVLRRRRNPEWYRAQGTHRCPIGSTCRPHRWPGNNRTTRTELRFSWSRRALAIDLVSIGRKSARARRRQRNYCL